jgi:D-inositol-3-phosphate glycosyltransferase
LKKIIIVGPAWPLRGGGLATFNERLARAYQDKGYEVEIFTFSLQYPSFLFPGKSQYSEETEPLDLKIKVRINSVNPLNWVSVGKEIKALQPDYVIFRYWLPFMAPCLGTISRIIRRGRIKTVAIVDNIIPHEKRIGDKWLSTYFVNSVDAFVTMSSAVLNDLKSFDQSKPKIFCPHPLYDNFGEPLSQEQAKRNLNLDESISYLLFFGFIRDYKGLDFLLKAFADERLRRFNSKLIIAGEFYSDPEPYLKMIEELGLKEQVVLATEFIPNESVRDYFSAADMVVQPYKSATQSGVTQTAYHFNKPMLVTNVGGLSETVRDGKAGYVVNPDPAAIADALFDFYQNNRKVEFEKGAEEEKKRFSWDALIKIVEQAVDSANL